MNILLVEDNPDDVFIISDILTHGTIQSSYYQEQFNIVSADTLTKAISLLSQQTFDVILTDLMLPDSRGTITVRRIHKAAPPEVPIIVLSGYLNKEVSQKTIQEGAQDCLIKGHIDFEIVTRAIFYAIERKKADEQLKKMAYFDQVTGLANYACLIMQLNSMLKRAQRYKETLSILFIDIDYFKSINDTFGHDVGNKVLKAVAQRFKECVRETDLIARIGGDEFVIVLNDISSRESIVSITTKLMKLLNTPYVINKQELLIEVSIGISQFPQQGDEGLILLKKADQAMYRVKKEGRNNFKFYDE